MGENELGVAVAVGKLDGDDRRLEVGAG